MSAPLPGEPVFAAPWEARTFALTLALHQRGLLAWDEWTAALGQAISRGEGAYYEQWLEALEELVVAHGLCDADHLRADQGWS
jgi:nitrile hydratase accessory protein